MSDIIPNLEDMTDAEKKAALDAIQLSIAKSKEVQKQRIGENVNLVIDALKKIEADIQSRYDLVGNTLEKRVASIKDGKDGKDGRDGKNGKDGRDGKQGVQGVKGENGRDGLDGVDGNDGIGVSFARIDFDGSLVIGLSSGVELNVGEVVAPDLAESIKVITNGGGTSQSVLDTLASLQTQINNLIPSQTGNSGKFLTTNGTSTSWANVAGGLTYQGTWNASTNTPTLASSTGTNGYYYIVATAGSTNLNGITDWQIGDWLMFNGSVWQKIDQSNLVTSVNGQTGAVSVGTVTSVSGTTGRITSTGGATPVLDLTSGVATAGTTGSASLIPVITIDTYGRVTSITTAANPQGTVTSVTGTSPVVSSGGATPAISLATAYGDTLNPYASKTANFVLAAPNGSAGVPTFRAVVAADIPTLNQNTTGSASGGASGAIAATTLTASGTTTLSGNQIISVTDNTNAALRITQLGTGNALLVEDSTNPDSTPFVVDASGNVGIGTTSPSVPLQIYNATSATLQVDGDAGSLIRATRYSTDTNAPTCQIRKARGTFASPTAVASGDTVATYQASAYGGTSYRAVSQIQGVVDTYTSDTNISGYLTFSTNVGSTAVTERMRITSAGGISFGTTGTAYGTSGQVLQSNGNAAPTWVTASGGASISNDTTTSSNLFPLFAAATSGTPTTIYTGNAKYLYKPSTGELTAPAHISSNGININSTTVSASYTIASGNNGFSVGPITVASGQAVTVASGQRWVVL